MRRTDISTTAATHEIIGCDPSRRTSQLPPQRARAGLPVRRAAEITTPRVHSEFRNVFGAGFRVAGKATI